MRNMFYMFKKTVEAWRSVFHVFGRFEDPQALMPCWPWWAISLTWPRTGRPWVAGGWPLCEIKLR